MSLSYVDEAVLFQLSNIACSRFTWFSPCGLLDRSNNTEGDLFEETTEVWSDSLSPPCYYPSRPHNPPIMATVCIARAQCVEVNCEVITPATRFEANKLNVSS